MNNQNCDILLNVVTEGQRVLQRVRLHSMCLNNIRLVLGLVQCLKLKCNCIVAIIENEGLMHLLGNLILWDKNTRINKISWLKSVHVCQVRAMQWKWSTKLATMATSQPPCTLSSAPSPSLQTPQKPSALWEKLKQRCALSWVQSWAQQVHIEPNRKGRDAPRTEWWRRGCLLRGVFTEM